MSRTLVSDDGRVKLYRVFDAQNNPVGWDSELVPTVEEINSATLRSRARVALTSNATFLGITSPTNAQNASQVKALTRQVNTLIRLSIEALDSTDGTT